MNSNTRVTLVLAMASFALYFSMYAFRKPFASAVWSEQLWGLDLKVWLVSAQLFGYASSKFWGIRLVSGLERSRRLRTLQWIFGFSLGTLVLLGLLPSSLKPLAMLLNGLSLGMVWGIIFLYLEGRRTTEFLGILLACSFVVSSGVVKSIGAMLMANYGLTAEWMPLAVGLLFLPIALGSMVWINRVADPDELDKSIRGERVPMGPRERRDMMNKAGIGVGLLSMSYILFTVLRDLRDNFAVELWGELGVANPTSMLAKSEWPITLVILGTFSLFSLISSNRTAFIGMIALMLAGSAMVVATSWLHQAGLIQPMAYMFLFGLGIYLVYIPITSILFDRMIGSMGLIGNTGFFMYIADASGYFGTAGLMILQNMGTGPSRWLPFILDLSYLFGIGAFVLFIGVLIWFRRQPNLKPIASDAKVSTSRL